MNRNDLLSAIELAKLPTRAQRRRFTDSAVYDAGTVQRRVLDGLDLDSEMRRRFTDEGLAYFSNELDRLDPQLITPLYNTSWADDIDTLTVGMGEESTSFIKQSWKAGGTQSATGKPWLNTNSNTLPGVAINGERLVKPLRPLGMELTVTEFEMARAQLTGRAIDTQKFDALNAHYQLGLDEMVYLGDTEVGALGLVNQPNTQVGTSNSAFGPFLGNTPGEIISDLQDMLRQGWENSAFNVVPSDLLLPPMQYAHIHATQMPNINETIASFFIRTSLSTQRNGTPLSIRPLKHLVGVGAGATDRMVAYSRRREFVRFPLMPIRRLKTFDQSISFHSVYVWIFGEVEMPRPETIIYRDNV